MWRSVRNWSPVSRVAAPHRPTWVGGLQCSWSAHRLPEQRRHRLSPTRPRMGPLDPLRACSRLKAGCNAVLRCAGSVDHCVAASSALATIEEAVALAESAVAHLTAASSASLAGPGAHTPLTVCRLLPGHRSARISVRMPCHRSKRQLMLLAAPSSGCSVRSAPTCHCRPGWASLQPHEAAGPPLARSDPGVAAHRCAPSA